MSKISWDDYRIAFQVAKSGTLSKAGKVLQINHATVLRHINRLEEALDTKLFIRHQRGYQLTDAGHVLMNELPEIQKSFSRLENLISAQEQDIRGVVRITTTSDYSSILNPALKAFREIYPKLRISIIATDDLVSLAEGVAHVAIRIGPSPTGADLIVKELTAPHISYFAAQEYVQRYGLPKNEAEYKQHLWALPSGQKRQIPFIQQVLKHIDDEQIIYQSNQFPDIQRAVIEGMAIGPVGSHIADQYDHLKQLDIKIDLTEERLWYVYHKDLKNSRRIKALYQFLRNSLPNDIVKNVRHV